MTTLGHDICHIAAWVARLLVAGQLRSTTLRGGPEWRNGRRSGLKLRSPAGRRGSNPGSGTSHGRGRRGSVTRTDATQAGVDVRRGWTAARYGPSCRLADSDPVQRAIARRALFSYLLGAAVRIGRHRSP